LSLAGSKRFDFILTHKADIILTHKADIRRPGIPIDVGHMFRSM